LPALSTNETRGGAHAPEWGGLPGSGLAGLAIRRRAISANSPDDLSVTRKGRASSPAFYRCFPLTEGRGAQSAPYISYGENFFKILSISLKIPVIKVIVTIVIKVAFRVITPKMHI
jgi:hypothetical protein